MEKFLKVLKVIGLFLLYSVYMCVILVLARHGLNYFYNEHVLNHYEDGDYSINDNLLLTLNYIEPYIVYYNNGDIYYKNSLYEDAIESYQAALEYDNVPEDRRCKARVNISLSIIAQLPEDYDTYENIPEFCYSASFDEVAEKGFTLVPSRYIEFVNRDENIDFETKMKSLQSELQELLKEEEKSKAELLNVFKELGYEIKL